MQLFRLTKYLLIAASMALTVLAIAAPPRHVEGAGAAANGKGKAPPRIVFACHQSPGQGAYSCWDQAGKALGHGFKDLAKEFPDIPAGEIPGLLENFEAGCVPSLDVPACATTRFVLQGRVTKGQSFCRNILGTRHWWQFEGSHYELRAESHRGNFHGERWALRVAAAKLSHLQVAAFPALRCRDGLASGDGKTAWSFHIQHADDALLIDEDSVASPRQAAGGVTNRQQFVRFMKGFKCSIP